MKLKKRMKNWRNRVNTRIDCWFYKHFPKWYYKWVRLQQPLYRLFHGEYCSKCNFFTSETDYTGEGVFGNCKCGHPLTFGYLTSEIPCVNYNTNREDDI